MIRHAGSEKEYTVPVTWKGSTPASGEATFTVPKDAYAGTYQIFVNDTRPITKAYVTRLAQQQLKELS